MRIDPTKNEVISTPIIVGRGPGQLAASADAIWVVNQASRSVSRIEPQMHKVVADIPLDDEPGGIVATADAVWVSRKQSGTVVKIDLQTNRIVGTPIQVGVRPGLMAVGEGALWVTNSFGNDVSRIALQ